MFKIPPLLVYEDGAVLVATLNNPENRNVITARILSLLEELVDIFRINNHLKVMLIRATGSDFCAGIHADLKKQGNCEEAATNVREQRFVEYQHMHRVCDEMERIEKPVVIAHHAACVGGGLELSLSCDFRLAARGAWYSFLEERDDESSSSNGVSRLTRIVGTHWARYLIMANMAVDANRALMMGLVHEVFPDETFDHDVMAFCQKLARQRGERIGSAKVAIELVRDMGLAQARHVERMNNSSLAKSPRIPAEMVR